jgi:hypothetical protein
MTPCTSPFRWAEYPRPSIFASDTTFTGSKRTGKTASQTSTEAADRYVQRTGRSAGSIPGISTKGDLLIEESNHRRAR